MAKNIFKNLTNLEILTIGSETTNEITSKKDKIFQELSSDSEARIYTDEKDQYKYWSNDLIKSLGIENTEDVYFVNIKRRSIISYSGLKYEGKMYYTLEQLPDGLYNVEYNSSNV